MLLLDIDVENEMSDDEIEDQIISDDSEASSDEEIEDNVTMAGNREPHMKSRNGYEIWQCQPLEDVQHQHRRHDILREASGPTRQALESGCGDSPSRAFKVFMNTECMNIIVRHTNEEAHRHEENWWDIDVEELYVFLGLLILAGVYHAKNEAVVQLWSKEHGRPIFNKAMSRNR